MRCGQWTGEWKIRHPCNGAALIIGQQTFSESSGQLQEMMADVPNAVWPGWDSQPKRVVLAGALPTSPAPTPTSAVVDQGLQRS